MSLQKAKAFVIVLAALLLSGCGQALSEREIVRAVFFVQQQGSYSACLLLADQNAGEDGTHYKTASALGVTPVQALHRAEMALPGQLYYGLLELAALPPGCDWATAQELGELLYDKAQPAPELSVFVLDSADHSWAQDAAALYEDMKAVEREYALHCGLQQLFTQADGCAVPGYRADSGYNFYLMPRNADILFLAGMPAQLAAVLCGQTNRFCTSYADGTALCEAAAGVTVEGSDVQLHLRDAKWETLSAAANDPQVLLCAELQQGFSLLTAKQTADFFHFHFFYENLYGPAAAPPAPTLEILFE